jgi:hypothetical protein
VDLVETEDEDLVETEDEDLVETEDEDFVETEDEDLVETEEEELVDAEDVTFMRYPVLNYWVTIREQNKDLHWVVSDGKGDLENMIQTNLDRNIEL